MNTVKKNTYFEKLTNEFLIPNFVYPLSKYNINYLNTIHKFEKYALIATVIFHNHGVKIPFQYKLTDEQFTLYNNNKNDVIDIIVSYFFDNYTCKYLVETYGIFKIIKKVIDECGAENMTSVYKNKNADELYCYYTYYILLEYFDNIVNISNNKDNIATEEDIIELEKIINDMTKNKVRVI